MSRLLALLLAVLLAVGALGCGSVLDSATRIANASTVLIVEGRPLVEDGIARDVANGSQAGELEHKWRPIVEAFDRLVDTTIAIREAVKTGRAAEKAGGDPSTGNLLVLAAEAQRLMAAVVAAFPELSGFLK